MTKTYTDFQNATSSEKVGLAIIEPARRLMGWVLDSGSVYKLTSFTDAVIVMIEDTGVEMTSVASRASVVAGSYFFDRINQILYLQTSDSVNPNGKFIALTFRLYFANMPIIAPNDLATGYQVEWLPYFLGSSQFGVALDNQEQIGNAIEGTGTIDFLNDQSFWISRFDKYFFENKTIYIYSWNRNLAYSEAKLIFKGLIEGKQYAADKITFNLRDTLKQFRSPYPLTDLSFVSGGLIPINLLQAKQRRVFGYVNGHRPTNINQLVNGSYPTGGTATVANASPVITISGIDATQKFTKNDNVSFDNGVTQYSISSVDSGTQITLTQNYVGIGKSGLTILVYPSRPKTYTNRLFQIAGHSIKQPSATVTTWVTPISFIMSNTDCMFAGDEIILNSTEIATIKDVNGLMLTLVQIPQTVVTVGMIFKRSSIQNVYLGAKKLLWNRDYIYSAVGGTMALTTTAEVNISPVLTIPGTVTFVLHTNTIVGVGTTFTNNLAEGDYISVFGHTDYVEVVTIVDDLNLVVRAGPVFSASGAILKKTPTMYVEGTTVLSCDVLGATSDGTTTGPLVSTAADIVKQIVTDLGYSSSINSTAFAEAALSCPYRLGLAIPTRYDERVAPTARDVINSVSESVFGAFIQSPDFLFDYKILDPSRPSSSMSLMEKDLLTWSINSLSQNITSQIQFSYAPKEYDRSVSQANVSYLYATSANGTYLAKSGNITQKSSILVDQQKAQFQANRWALLLEMASTVFVFTTKLQASRVEIGDKIQIIHEKLFQRIGTNDSRKIAAVQASSKDIGNSQIELEDLSNALSRCSVIAATGSPDFNVSGPNDRAFSGYITDQYGLINNDPNTFGTNLIW